MQCKEKKNIIFMNYSSVYFLNIKQSHIILVVIDLLCYEGLITKECRYK
jgi:hypothetical protein